MLQLARLFELGNNPAKSKPQLHPSGHRTAEQLQLHSRYQNLHRMLPSVRLVFGLVHRSTNLNYYILLLWNLLGNTVNITASNENFPCCNRHDCSSWEAILQN